MQYKYECPHFHSRNSDYIINRDCTFDFIADDRQSVLVEAVRHLTQPLKQNPSDKNKIPKEHLYQDNPQLQQDADDSIVKVGG